MELPFLNSGTLAENYRETNNKHIIEISFLNLNIKLSYLVQFPDNSKDCVSNDKWSAIKMASFY